MKAQTAQQTTSTDTLEPLPGGGGERAVCGPSFFRSRPEAIPDALRTIPQWLAYRAVPVPKTDGSQKLNKIPVDPKTGRNGKSNDPATWGTFAEAVGFIGRQAPGWLGGLGFAFTSDAEVSAIDLDHCLDEAGELLPEAAELVAAFNSWTEMSPSGSGVHIWIKGTLEGVTSAKYPPGAVGFPFGVEIFCDRFFMTVTGITPEGSTKNIEDRQAVLTDLYDRLEAAKLATATQATAPSTTPEDVDRFEETVIRGKLASLKPGPRQVATGTKGDAGHKWILTCPWADQHTGGADEAGVMWFEGRPSFKCLHTHCAARHYEHLAAKYDLPQPSFVDEFNARHGVCRVGSQTVIVTEEGDEVTFSKPEAWATFYANRTQTVKTGNKTVVVKLWPAWMQHEQRRTYARVVFAPNRKTESAIYNLWRGFGVAPRPGDWSLMYNHLLDVICDGNDRHFDYLMQWCARAVQEPGGDRPGVAVVLRGKQGVGKGMFAQHFGQLFGRHFLHLIHDTHLIGRFNSILRGKIVVFADEAVFAGDPKAANVLKGLITERWTPTESKGIDPVVTESHMNLIMASNSSHVVQADPDARRLFVLDVADIHRQDSAYFAALQNQMDTGGREAWMYDLLHHPWQDVNLRTPPRTDALMNQKLQSLDPVRGYWQSCLDDGAVHLADADLRSIAPEEWPEQAQADEVHQGYLAFCRRLSKRHTVASNVFWRQLREYTGLPFELGRPKAGNRKRTYALPDIEVARAAWARRMEGS